MRAQVVNPENPLMGAEGELVQTDWEGHTAVKFGEGDDEFVFVFEKREIETLPPAWPTVVSVAIGIIVVIILTMVFL